MSPNSRSAAAFHLPIRRGCSVRIASVAETFSLDITNSSDPVVEAYKKDVDRTLIRENLKKSYEERILALEEMLELVYEVRRAGKVLRGEQE